MLSNLSIMGAVPIFVLGVLWITLKEKRTALSNCLSLCLAAYVCLGIIRLVQNPGFFHKVQIIVSAENSESNFSNPYLSGIHPNPKYQNAFQGYPWLLDLFVFMAKRSEKALSEASSLSPKFAAYDAIVLFASDEEFDKPLKILARLKDPDGPALAKDLQFALGKNPDSKLSDEHRLVQESEIDLKSRLEPSWYRNVALGSMYTRWGEHKRLEALKVEERAKAIASNARNAPSSIFCWGAAVIGTLFCVSQPFIWWLRRRGKIGNWLQPAQTFPKYSLKTILDVVLAYAAIRTLVGGLFRDVVYGNLMPDASQTFGIMVMITYFKLVVNATSLLFAYLIAFRPAKIGFKEGIGLRFKTGNIGPLKMSLAGCLTFCSLFPFVGLTRCVSMVFGLGETANPISVFITAVGRSGESATVVLSALLIAFFGPFLEEAFCRGFLFSALKAKYGTLIGVLISSFFFAAIHLDLPGFLPLFSMGVVFALAYWKTNSIVPSLIAHCAWNGMTLLSAMLLH